MERGDWLKWKWQAPSYKINDRSKLILSEILVNSWLQNLYLLDIFLQLWIPVSSCLLDKSNGNLTGISNNMSKPQILILSPKPVLAMGLPFSLRKAIIYSHICFLSLVYFVVYLLSLDWLYISREQEFSLFTSVISVPRTTPTHRNFQAMFVEWIDESRMYFICLEECTFF